VLIQTSLTAISALIHIQKASALCVSGGGIRSATFALGVLQGLARTGLLQKFDYLSTVSGGGYIGGWLSSWAHRDPGGLGAVAKSLDSQPQKKLDPEPVTLGPLTITGNRV
jgi:predicted acylesterase/phospholipase RssA